MLQSMILTTIFKVILSICYFDKYRLDKCKHCYCHKLGSQVFAIEGATTFSRSLNSKCENLENGES